MKTKTSLWLLTALVLSGASLSFAAVPAAPTLNTPTGTIIVAIPDFDWNSEADADYYYLCIQNQSQKSIFKQQFPAATVDNGDGTCTVNPGKIHDDDTSYFWMVRATNGDGDGPWSDKKPYAVDTVQIKPVAPTLNSPNGTISQVKPEFNWNSLADATLYKLYVQNQAQKNIFYQWYSPADVDNGDGTCSIIYRKTLVPGSYYWMVRAKNDYGKGPISDKMAFTFTPSLLPDTGQITCYNAAGNVINPCPSPGEAFYGQDACYTINPPSYSKLDAGGNVLPGAAVDWAMVKDNVTGLIWEVKTDDGGIHDKDDTYTWADASSVFIAQLNTDQLGGYNDWRLPSIKEINQLTDFGTINPAIDDDFFPNTVYSLYYWTATTYAITPANARRVIFNTGLDGHADKSNAFHVRGVRGTQTALSFKDNGDGTITDNTTGLMWAKETADINDDSSLDVNDQTDWQTALAWCENLSLAGHDDWRLPTLKELKTIVDFSTGNPAIDDTYFPDTMSSFYGTSTSSRSSSDWAWGVFFSSGNSSISMKVWNSYVRPVRGGQ